MFHVFDVRKTNLDLAVLPLVIFTLLSLCLRNNLFCLVTQLLYKSYLIRHMVVDVETYSLYL